MEICFEGYLKICPLTHQNCKVHLLTIFMATLVVNLLVMMLQIVYPKGPSYKRLIQFQSYVVSYK